MKPIFFFGTLRDPVLLALVIGRPLAETEAPEARADGWAPYTVAGEAYPMLKPAPGEVATGRLFTPRTQDEVEAILYYEEAEYALTPITVTTAAGAVDGYGEGAVEAAFFDATTKLRPGTQVWSFEDWWARDRAVALEAAAELMPLRASLPVERIDDVWPGIMNRARQRARAAASTPALGGIRQDFDAARDVVWELHERPYNGYLAVERHILRHRLFDGGMSAPVDRLTVGWGDAVTVLPYDPVTDQVLLIEQFRPAPAARRDPNPWCIEVPAGRIDADEDAETAIRREAAEEANVTLGRLLALPGYYPTPGLGSEHLGAWIGEADLAHYAGGTFGEPGEGEDIRAFALPFSAALEALRAGAVNTGPAQILLLWLAVERDRLRAAWAAAPAAQAAPQA
ncbi:MAG: NUDIX domain-containing protein [Pseudomonadota bacterium]